MMDNSDIRWQQRFKNFERALHLLAEFVDEPKDIFALKPITKEGFILRFRATFELAWKTLKDKMEHDGLSIEKASPKYVLKLAYQANYITNIESWLAMCNDRNLMSHTYDFKKFDKVLKSLQDNYYTLLSELHTDLIEAQLK